MPFETLPIVGNPQFDEPFSHGQCKPDPRGPTMPSDVGNGLLSYAIERFGYQRRRRPLGQVPVHGDAVFFETPGEGGDGRRQSSQLQRMWPEIPDRPAGLLQTASGKVPRAPHTHQAFRSML
jgi:hypothetical protein